MVETQTKRLLEATVDEPNESGGINKSEGSDNSQELEGVNVSHVEEEMVYLHNPAEYDAPEEFINLVGGPHKFGKLMKCVESDGRSKMYITMFRSAEIRGIQVQRNSNPKCRKIY